jgi:hypothetical protein
MSTERKEFESWVARVRLPYCDTPADRAQQWIGWQGCRASPAAAVPEGALPPLPTEKLLRIIAENTGKRINLSLDDLDQYLSVARAAVEADRAQRPENTQQQEGCDSALRAEPAWRKTQAPCSVCEGQNYQCHHCDGMGIEPRKIDHYGDCRCVLSQYCDGKCNPVFADELASRCRAEGGDGANRTTTDSVAVGADRAQQGEPVAWACALNLDHTPMETPDVEWGAECTWAPEFKPFPLYRAATKAAAAADAPKLSRNEIQDMAFAYCPSGQIGELQEFAEALLARVAAPVPDTGDRAPAGDAREEVQQKIDLQLCVLEWNRAQSKPPIEIGKEYFVAQEIAAMLARRASSTPAVPGTKVVPITPTLEMVKAGDATLNGRGTCVLAWRAMLAAAPSHPSEAKTCTCPSGDGSLRWPCQVHPSEAKAGEDA